MSFMRTGEGIVLQGQVTYAATGLPATGGEVKFFVCKAQGGYAPASACQNGSGRWSPAFTSWVPVISAGPWAGYARALFDDCPPGVTMGFYFQYRGLRTGIADGKSAPADYTEPL